ncbi:PIN domain-containing protein [Corticibacterium sp. UT-5YL-CI-8]|nr:PIN domain-containing protein [Tianweitania sp. UT-5YL-CI-8]
MMFADTSIWIDHFRQSDRDIVGAINNDGLLCHLAVIGELALGSLHDRRAVLGFLTAPRQAIVATHDEIMTMIEHHQIYSIGIGYTDAQLLASTLIDDRAELFTRDKRLRAAAEKVGARLYPPGTALNL